MTDCITVTIAGGTPPDVFELIGEWLNRKINGRPFVYVYDASDTDGDWSFAVHFFPPEICDA